MGFEVGNMFIKISWAPVLVWMVVYSSACNFAELAQIFLNIVKSFAKFYIQWAIG